MTDLEIREVYLRPWLERPDEEPAKPPLAYKIDELLAKGLSKAEVQKQIDAIKTGKRKPDVVAKPAKGPVNRGRSNQQRRR